MSDIHADSPVEARPEPWMRGPIAGVHPMLAPVLYSFQHAVEDLALHTEGMDREQLWARPFGVASIGFHIRHIGGSVDRLLTYALGKQLSPAQLEQMSGEQTPGASREDLLAGLQLVLDAAAGQIRRIRPGELTALREVGRKRLPSTTIGLLVHISEHTLRHVGQAVTTAKVLQQFPLAESSGD